MMGSQPIRMKHWDFVQGVVQDSLEKFLELHNIIISHVSKDDTMFTLHDHEPACVILTLLNF